MSDKEKSQNSNVYERSTYSRQKKQTALCIKAETRIRTRKIGLILKKQEHERNSADRETLATSPDLVELVKKRYAYHDKVKFRQLEIEDVNNDLVEKCTRLVDILRHSRCTVVYTGAGVSTAADIPDYRGPNGVWTLLKRGEHRTMSTDLTCAQPTVTHMALSKLYQQGLVSHVLSQNCDGLHVRSGLPRHVLSEIHGNMYIEVCKNCSNEHLRLFDVTERTSYHRHATGRSCHRCHGDLHDSIVHFGEKGRVKSPHNWNKVVCALEKCEVIVSLGSSLKVLKRYHCLWPKNAKLSRKPILVIVNLQWTPKDKVATLKINGKCDKVMKLVMERLGIDIPPYEKSADPLFRLHTPLRESEIGTNSTKQLSPPPSPSDQPLCEKQETRSGKDEPPTGTTAVLKTLHGDGPRSSESEVIKVERSFDESELCGNHDAEFECLGIGTSAVDRGAEKIESKTNRADLVSLVSLDDVSRSPGWFGKGLKRGGCTLRRRKKYKRGKIASRT